MVTLHRSAVVQAGGSNATGEAVLCFASEYPVLRRDDPSYGCHLEILSHSPGDVRLDILNTSGPVWLNHNEADEIGNVIPGSVHVGADRRARCAIRMLPEFAALLEAIKRQAAPNQVSVGYIRKGVVGRSVSGDGTPIIRFAFEPYEVSILTRNHKPADPTAGIYRKLIL